MFHGLALLAVSAHPRLAQKRIAAGAIAVGTALFSGSLYGMVWARSKGVQAGKYLGPVTPLGGIPLACCTDFRSHYACWMDCFDFLT